MSEQSQGSGWWKASDGRWYPPDTHPDYRRRSSPEGREGWWQASDGNWYPPEQHPDFVRRPPEPTVPVAAAPPRTERLAFSEPPAADPAFARRPALWHERRGVRVAGGIFGVIVLLGIFGSLTDDDEEPSTRLRSDLVQTTVSSIVEETSTIATTTTTSTTTPPMTVATTVVTTVATAPITTAATSPATTAASSRQGVTPGAFCAPEGAHGVTNTGRAMECRTEGENRARWRAA